MSSTAPEQPGPEQHTPERRRPADGSSVPESPGHEDAGTAESAAPAAVEAGTPASALPALVFRHSPLGLAAVVAACVFAVPFAFGAPWLWLVYLLPVGVAVWIVRVRTVVDTEAVTVRNVVGSRRVAWVDVSALRLGKKSRVSAVLSDSAEVPLPAVHVRDLPALAAVSGGRLPDPAGE